MSSELVLGRIEIKELVAKQLGASGATSANMTL